MGQPQMALVGNQRDHPRLFKNSICVMSIEISSLVMLLYISECCSHWSLKKDISSNLLSGRGDSKMYNKKKMVLTKANNCKDMKNIVYILKEKSQLFVGLGESK